MLSTTVLSQPAWKTLNTRQSFTYSRGEMEEQVESQNPGLVYYSQGDLKNEFYSHNDEPILKFVSFQAECQE